MPNKTKSTFDQVMGDAKQKKKFEKEYAQFLFSELLLEAMEEEHLSVRALSKKSGVSTSVIQNMRSMKPLGYKLAAEKGGKRVNLSA